MTEFTFTEGMHNISLAVMAEAYRQGFFAGYDRCREAARELVSNLAQAARAREQGKLN